MRLTIISAIALLGGLLPCHAHGADASKIIFGSTKAETDLLLKDWRSEKKDNRESRLSGADRSVFYYTKDVSIITIIRDGKVIGVAVIDRPGAGIKSISETRFNELVAIVGKSPKEDDVVKDADGIHEFYIGDTDL